MILLENDSELAEDLDHNLEGFLLHVSVCCLEALLQPRQQILNEFGTGLDFEFSDDAADGVRKDIAAVVGGLRVCHCISQDLRQLKEVGLIEQPSGALDCIYGRTLHVQILVIQMLDESIGYSSLEAGVDGFFLT